MEEAENRNSYEIAPWPYTTCFNFQLANNGKNDVRASPVCMFAIFGPICNSVPLVGSSVERR